MLLTKEDREKFIGWLEQEIKTDEILLDQMQQREATGTFMKTALGSMIIIKERDILGQRIVLNKLQSYHD